MTDQFRLLPWTNSVVFQDGPVRAIGLLDGMKLRLETDGSVYVAVFSGELAMGRHLLRGGMYACLPVIADLEPTIDCRAMVVVAKNYRGMFTLGGPVEERGRLRYIDGCTDTGLIAPLRKGDPCLNYLHFPPGTVQSAHTHPSHRIGLIVGGAGRCHVPGGATGMAAGDMFLIPANAVHWFSTGESDMRIVIFHPDSEFGPTDEAHQMLAATITEGVEA